MEYSQLKNNKEKPKIKSSHKRQSFCFKQTSKESITAGKRDGSIQIVNYREQQSDLEETRKGGNIMAEISKTKNLKKPSTNQKTASLKILVKQTDFQPD